MDAGRRGPNKKTIAKESLRQLTSIVELCRESGNWDVGATEFHANSANNYMDAVKKGGLEIPEIITRNARFLKVHGWRIP
jgi:hypothetical protein